jgi:hypothetical protein
VTDVRFTVDLRLQELAGVRACDSCDARQFAVDAWGRLVVARGGGVMDVTGRRGVVAVAT